LNAFAETSFFCALYRVQDNSPEAYRLAERLKDSFTVSSLVIFEFRQSVRLQTFRFSADRKQGYSPQEAARLLNALQANIDCGALQVAPVDWPDVYNIAEGLSAQLTAAHGFRSLDLLHVATALHLKAAQFLTFDARQSALAKAAGLKVRP
jgi:predicted nucleic acid-binding protein